jgi:flagellin-like hook-associated protein FlgL
MGVTLDTSHTGAINRSLDGNLKASRKASLQLATGKENINACDDPTATAIAARLKASQIVIETVAKGLSQSEALFYNAESALKAVLDIIDQMEVVASRAQLGYMTDELVESQLSPTYGQLKAEYQRIINSVEFNGVKLLNGTGGEVANGTAATLTSVQNGIELSGGVPATSTFRFVAGENLGADVIKAVLPNLSLDSIVPKLDMPYHPSTSALTGLTDLETVSDAVGDTYILKALRSVVIDTLGQVGALETRVKNAIPQLQTYVDLLKSAAGPLKDADLAEASTRAAEAAVRIALGIARISAENEHLDELKRLAA